VSIQFGLYSTEIEATLDPWNASPAPITLVDLGEDGLYGDYNPNAGSSGRGSRITTLGGAVDQDFGSFEEDGQIMLSLTSVPIAEATITSLLAAYSAVDQQYYWTDSVNCWLVKFVKPDGMKVARVLFYKAAANEDVFNVELALKIVSKEI
jgi:hypothetical protein